MSTGGYTITTTQIPRVIFARTLFFTNQRAGDLFKVAQFHP
jgi:hypothetical protein